LSTSSLGPMAKPRDAAYAGSIDRCAACLTTLSECWPRHAPKPSDPHHLGFTRAPGPKVSDEFAVPLCRGHHRAVHRSRDERAWWRQAGIDPIKVARRLWKETHGMGQRKSRGPAFPRPHEAAASSEPSPKTEQVSATAKPQESPPHWVFSASRARAARSSRLLIASFLTSSDTFSHANTDS
jgi:hypothetical protein